MAEILLSAGVLARENDSSFITAQPIQAGAAILGPTTKGPTVPTVVTSYSQFVNKYGGAVSSGSNYYTYFTNVAAYNYFQQGGTSLLVGRVTNGTYTAASSSTVPTGSGGPITGLSPFTLETLSKGTIMNSNGPLGTNGTLASGSVDNLRWEIAGTNTATGTFSLIIRQGNDTQTTKTILETWNNLSLDPKASNYIEKIIGDQAETIRTDGGSYYVDMTGSYSNASAFVRVSSVNYTTPDYLDNNGTAKLQYTGSIPVASSGTFGGAIGSPFSTREAKFYQSAGLTLNGDSQGVTGSDYTTMLGLLSNTQEYQYNTLTAPGLNTVSAPSTLTSMVSIAQDRGDDLVVLDTVPFGSSISSVISNATSYDTSYGATYWPWVQTKDPELGGDVWVPASTLVPGVFAFTDNTSEPWFTPAGFTRGGLSTVGRAERKLSQVDKNTLYTNNVNPIGTFAKQGVVIFGQKTLQKKASALSRVNVRRLLIDIKGYITQIADSLVFELNTNATRNLFLSQVNPYLTSVQQREGLYAFQVKMDDSNNTADVIDRNELRGQIYIQPTIAVEYIYLDFNITPTGVVFPI